MPEQQWKPDTELHRHANDLRARFEVKKQIWFGHFQTLQVHPGSLKPISFDGTL
jgi:hypothetical protein